MTPDPFLRQLSELCRSHPTRPKWVFVPAHAVGLTLGTRLAREGARWANLRFVTPLDVAIRMAAPFLLERHIEPSEEKLGAALVMRLLLDLPEAGGYFRPMADHSSMADALWRAIREARYAGLHARDLAGRRFTALGHKHAELVSLFAAYEHELEVNGVADMPQVFEEAIRHRDWCPIAMGDLVLQLPATRWPRLVERFLDALPGERVHPPAASSSPEPAGSSSWDPASAGFVGASPERLEIFHAGGRDAEIDEIFRRIRRSGLPLDQVEIACAPGVPQSLAWEKAVRLDWPVTLSAGLPAVMTRPGRLLLRFCDWIGSRLEAAELRKLLQSGDCWGKAFDAPADDGEPDLTPGQAARLLLRAQVTWGGDTYARSLSRLAAEYERRAGDPEASEEDAGWNARKARQSRALLSWVAAVLRRLPASALAGSGPVRLTALVDAAIPFLADNAARWSKLDALGLEAVKDALEDLRSLGGYECTLDAALRFLRERAASLSVGRDRPRPGHLHVSSIRDAGYDGRPLVFVAGLEEGAVFPAAVEDAVLLDEERSAFDPLLLTSTARQAEEVRHGLARLDALAGSGAHLCFSFSCRDTRDFRETFPSWIVLEAFRFRQADPALSYKQLREFLGDPASAVPPTPDDALTDSAWWLAGGARAGAGDAILAAFPSLERGRVAVSRRELEEFTEFDGFVPQAGAVLDPTVTGRPVSATTLERAAKCPLRFFMEHGLGVRPIEEGRQDEDAWLAAATKGTELHDLYARVLRAARTEGRKASLAIDKPRLLQWGRKRLEELRREMPPPSDEVYARESREFLEDLEAFITAECEGRHGDTPIAFEVPFGFAVEEGGEEPLASPDALVLSIGGTRRFVLHGRIDRINRVGRGLYEVADYKGSYWRDDWQGTFAGGTRLQHAIYGAAAARLLQAIDRKARVVGGTYLFPSVKGHRAVKRIDAPSAVELQQVLRDLADTIGSGAFAPADLDSSCKWCEFKAACHAEKAESVKAKVQSAANGALEAYRRLRQHP